MTKSKNMVGLPYPNPTKAYWQTPPLPISDHRTTTHLPPSTKYVIVGSGISGAIIAYKLLKQEPSASIVMLEARQACSGATGRNGGHCRAGRYTSFKNDLESFGENEALLMEKLEEDNVKNVGKLVEETGIDCDLRNVETLDIFCDPKHLDDALAALEARKRVLEGHVEMSVLTKHRIWSAKETREALLIPQGLGAISYPAYALSPYKLVCGVLDRCLQAGLNLQTNTPVVEVSQTSSRDGKNWWTVHTERGEIVAQKVILATNAYTAALYPPLSEFIVPTRAQIAAIRPGSSIAGNPALKRTCGLERAISGEYMQSRAEGTSGEGDIIIGGGRRLGTPQGENGEKNILDDSTINPVISHYLTSVCSEYYFGKKNWGENGETLQEWTGIMAYTPDEQPVVGEAPGQEGLFISAGFNGHGMALTFQAAEALVQIMMGNEGKIEKWFPKSYKLSRVPIPGN